jgi:antitoxin VapB
MTFQLSREIEQLTLALARRTGKSPETLIEEAIEERARAAGVFVAKPRRPFDEAKAREIIARVAALPVLDERTPDEIIGYGEHGVPE